MVKRTLRAVLPRKSWDMLRLLNYRLTMARFRPRVVRHNYGGEMLDIHIGDPTAQRWYDRDLPEFPEIALLRRGRLKPGARVFDCGAHQCVVAMMLERAVRPGGQVIAVEAIPYNAEQGRKNQSLNRVEGLVVINAAVAEHSGSLRLNGRLNGQVDNRPGQWGSIEVPAVTIDHLSRQYGAPDVLFVDLEGFELQALRGAVQTLKSRPDCFVEVHVGCGLEKFGGSVESLVSLLSGYELMMAPGHGEFTPFQPGSPILNHRFFLVALAC
jgi:FkbM family methyltransferase